MKSKREDLTKKQVNRFLSEIYKLLRDGSCWVRWKKYPKDDQGIECVALYDPCAAEGGDDIIWISTESKHDLIDSIIHECLHDFYNDFSESRIKWMTAQIRKKMSACQCAHLIMALVENLKKHYSFPALKRG